MYCRDVSAAADFNDAGNKQEFRQKKNIMRPLSHKAAK